jgi:DNA-binding transcriptional ArsR family regulator
LIEDKNPDPISTDDIARPVWWVTAEEHRFALEVLQLGLRRKMLGAIALSCRSLSQIEVEFDLSPAQAEYHLSMLEKALVIERAEDCWSATPTGILYLENVERH